MTKLPTEMQITHDYCSVTCHVDGVSRCTLKRAAGTNDAFTCDCCKMCIGEQGGGRAEDKPTNGTPVDTAVQFVPGQWVVCVQSLEHRDRRILKGHRYQVTRLHERGLEISGEPGMDWPPSRFRAATVEETAGAEGRSSLDLLASQQDRIMANADGSFTATAPEPRPPLATMAREPWDRPQPAMPQPLPGAHTRELEQLRAVVEEQRDAHYDLTKRVAELEQHNKECNDVQIEAARCNMKHGARIDALEWAVGALPHHDPSGFIDNGDDDTYAERRRIEAELARYREACGEFEDADIPHPSKMREWGAQMDRDYFALRAKCAALVEACKRARKIRRDDGIYGTMFRDVFDDGVCAALDALAEPARADVAESALDSLAARHEADVAALVAGRYAISEKYAALVRACRWLRDDARYPIAQPGGESVSVDSAVMHDMLQTLAALDAMAEPAASDRADELRPGGGSRYCRPASPAVESAGELEARAQVAALKAEVALLREYYEASTEEDNDHDRCVDAERAVHEYDARDGQDEKTSS